MKLKKGDVGKTATVIKLSPLLAINKIAHLHGKKVKITAVEGKEYKIKFKDKEYKVDPACVKDKR